MAGIEPRKAEFLKAVEEHVRVHPEEISDPKKANELEKFFDETAKKFGVDKNFADDAYSNVRGDLEVGLRWLATAKNAEASASAKKATQAAALEAPAKQASVSAGTGHTSISRAVREATGRPEGVRRGGIDPKTQELAVTALTGNIAQPSALKQSPALAAICNITQTTGAVVVEARRGKYSAADVEAAVLKQLGQISVRDLPVQVRMVVDDSPRAVERAQTILQKGLARLDRNNPLYGTEVIVDYSADRASLEFKVERSSLSTAQVKEALRAQMTALGVDSDIPLQVHVVSTKDAVITNKTIDFAGMKVIRGDATPFENSGSLSIQLADGKRVGVIITRDGELLASAWSDSNGPESRKLAAKELKQLQAELTTQGRTTDQWIEHVAQQLGASGRGPMPGAELPPNYRAVVKKNAALPPVDANFNATVHQYAGEVFVDPKTGKILVEKESFADIDGERPFLRHNYFRADLNEGRARQLDDHSSGGVAGKAEHTSFTNGAAKTEVWRDDNHLFVTNPDGSQSSYVKLPADQAKQVMESLDYEALPKIWEPEYLATMPDGQYVYIDQPRYGMYDDFRVFVGAPGHLRELKVDHVTRWRDGGSTQVHTSEGDFYFPAAGNPRPFAFTPTSGPAVPIKPVDVHSKEAADVGLVKQFGTFDQPNVAMPPL